MPLQPKFNRFTTASPVTATFSFTDIANGTGVITLLAGGTNDPSADHFLSANALRTTLSGTSQGSTGSTDVDFDLTPFNLTRTATGTATVECDLNITAYSGVLAATLGARLYKWDGSTETAITPLVTSRDLTNVNLHAVLLLLPITDHVFQVGDILRLKMTITNEDGGVINCEFSYDPDGSKPLILNIPFKIDL